MLGRPTRRLGATRRRERRSAVPPVRYLRLGILAVALWLVAFVPLEVFVFCVPPDLARWRLSCSPRPTSQLRSPTASRLVCGLGGSKAMTTEGSNTAITPIIHIRDTRYQRSEVRVGNPARIRARVVAHPYARPNTFRNSCLARSRTRLCFWGRDRPARLI